MSSVGCPRCEESFRVPDAPLPPDIWLRCPWCLETFKLTEISQRLLPMVELIGDDGRVIELNSIVSLAVPLMAGVANSAASYRETLPAFEPISRIEPAELDQEDFEYSVDETESDSLDTQRTISTDDDLLSTIVADNNEDLLEMEPAGFDSDRFESNGDQVIEQVEDEPYEASDGDDPYQTFVDQSERMPVSGPVAPRPMKHVGPAEFGDTSLRSKPRNKKSGSPIKSIIGVIVGGLMSVPLAGGLLTLLGQKPDWGIWPFDGTTSTVVKPSRPMEFDDDREPRAINIGKSSSENLGPNSFGLDAPEADPSSVEEPLTPSRDTTKEPEPETVENSVSETVPTDDVAIKEPATEPMPSLEATDEPAIGKIVTEPTIQPTVEPMPEIAMPTEPEVTDIGAGANDNVKPIAAATPEISDSESPASASLLTAIEQTDEALRSVVNFADPSDAKGLRTTKSALYTAIANMALVPQALSQSETTAMLDKIASAGLTNEMGSVAPKWLNYSKRTNQGVFAIGKAVQSNSEWLLKLDDGTELQLKNLKDEAVIDGDQMVILGKIVEASPAAIIDVVYYNKKSSQ